MPHLTKSNPGIFERTNGKKGLETAIG